MENDVRKKESKTKEFSNIKFSFNFFLECNNEGRISVKKAVRDFLSSKDWAISKIDWELNFINS